MEGKDRKPPDGGPAGNPEDLPTLDSVPSPVQGGLAVRYDILNEIGRGGMGIVYKAKDRETGAVVALKVLRPEIASRPDLLDRFKAELLLARKITHKNLCRVYDLNRFGEVAAISMEYVEGESLRHILGRYSPLSVRRGVEWANQICSALAEAHAQGVVHRDLKPENILIDWQGAVKVMDFGIARSIETDATTTGTIVGTPAYMSPEQAEGRPADARSDIYSLGLILYEMFTGRPGLRAESPVALALMQIHETPAPPREVEPSLPAFLDRAIRKCLEKNPKKRFQSVTELEAALHEKAPHKPEPEKAELLAPEPHLVRWGWSDYVLMVAALGGLVLFWRFFLFVAPESYGKFTTDKRAAEREATRLFAVAGWGKGTANLKGAWGDGRLTPAVLSGLKNPVAELPALAADYERIVWHLEVVRQKTKFDFTINSEGRPEFFFISFWDDSADFRKQFRESVGPPLPSPDERMKLARKNLAEFFGVDAAQVTSELSDSVGEFLDLKTYDYSWASPNPDRVGWKEKYRIEVIGSSVLRASHSSEAPPNQEEFNRTVSGSTSSGGWVVLLMALLILPVFLLGRVYQTVRWRPIIFFITFLGLMNLYVFGPGGDATSGEFAGRIPQAIFTGLVPAGIYFTLEQLIRNRWPTKWLAVHMALQREFSHDSGVPWAVARGTVLAAAGLGIYGPLRFIGLRSTLAPWIPSLHSSVELRTFLPSLSVVVLCIRDAFVMTIFVSFTLVLLKRVIPNAALLTVSGALLWLLTRVHIIPDNTVPNLWFEFVIVFVLALMATFTFVRYDVLTLIVAVFSFDLLLRNSALWMLQREVGNLEPTIVFVLWGSVVGLSLFVIARRRLVEAYRRAVIFFE